jgi:NADH-quinone oxidoreductase subunit N
MRVLFTAVPTITVEWSKLLMVMAAITILYGNLCAIPQRNLKRLLGYSSIAHAGYLLLGFSVMSASGSSAILFYLSGYLFTVLAAFMVIGIALRGVEGEDINSIAGLHQRSPFLAGTLAIAMISLAGIPPLAGFFGKFLLLRAVLEKGASNPAYYWLTGIALVGITISFYYYLGVVRAMYWGESDVSDERIPISATSRALLVVCVIGMIYLGLLPARVLNTATQATQALGQARVIPVVAVR